MDSSRLDEQQQRHRDAHEAVIRKQEEERLAEAARRREEALVAEDRLRQDLERLAETRRVRNLEKLVGTACGMNHKANTQCKKIFDGINNGINNQNQGTIRVDDFRVVLQADETVALRLGLPKAFHTTQSGSDITAMLMKMFLAEGNTAAMAAQDRNKGFKSRLEKEGSLSRVHFVRYFSQRPYGKITIPNAEDAEMEVKTNQMAVDEKQRRFRRASIVIQHAMRNRRAAKQQEAVENAPVNKDQSFGRAVFSTISGSEEPEGRQLELSWPRRATVHRSSLGDIFTEINTDTSGFINIRQFM